MGRATSYKYIGSGDSWRTELFLVFILGFVLATALWLGVWYAHAKPAHAQNLQSCAAQKNELATLRAKVETVEEEAASQLAETSAKLDEALLGWGRCIRSNNKANQESNEGALSLGPSPASKAAEGNNN